MQKMVVKTSFLIQLSSYLSSTETNITMGKNDNSDKEEEQAPQVDETQEEAVDETREEGVDETQEEGAPSGGSKRKRKRKRKKKTTENPEEEQEEQDEQPDNHTSVVCTVYVEGIPFDATPDQVKEFFVSNGVEDVAELRLPTWQDSGRLRGYGHVLFDSEASYENALKLSGKYMQKRYLTIQTANVPKSGGSRPRVNTDPPPKDCQTLFVHNLPYGATEDEIHRVFEKHGEVAEDGVRIARNSVTRQSKGFAYVDFESPKDARKVMKACIKKALVVGGRMVRLDYDTGRMKGSFRAESGLLWTKEHGDDKDDKRQRTD
jgi:nucleolin